MDIELPELEGKTAKMYKGGKICQTVHFHPLWSRNVPHFGIAHALALSVRLFLLVFLFCPLFVNPVLSLVSSDRGLLLKCQSWWTRDLFSTRRRRTNKQIFSPPHTVLFIVDNFSLSCFIRKHYPYLHQCLSAHRHPVVTVRLCNQTLAECASLGDPVLRLDASSPGTGTQH